MNPNANGDKLVGKATFRQKSESYPSEVETSFAESDDAAGAYKDKKGKKGDGYNHIKKRRYGDARPEEIGPLKIKKVYNGDNSCAFKN